MAKNYDGYMVTCIDGRDKIDFYVSFTIRKTKQGALAYAKKNIDCTSHATFTVKLYACEDTSSFKSCYIARVTSENKLVEEVTLLENDYEKAIQECKAMKFRYNYNSKQAYSVELVSYLRLSKVEYTRTFPCD